MTATSIVIFVILEGRTMNQPSVRVIAADRNAAYKIFNSEAAAVAALTDLDFEEGELVVRVDPKGSGRCFIEVLDLDDGAVIGRI